ncbi:anti-FecI sigma factor FecR [Thauera linaloolentis 47Lol = DSM 12138]|uniref:Anti-FecI sigma factor FecR n=1 Tax=Thauera linaloolentis (strain DSM 12138 / JCM 21573 / CCUG 41526 / CIP 105981 / IAM 15112 / NBRC 102519 / 47Lol) TaxID=1123367 RepID=N6Y4X0_THAL4|nr:anti-FecI sigma factor FecR [Thauera linaloolentis 47Lol = DSM 12138]
MRATELESALAPYADALRAHLPSADDILQRAAQRRRKAGARRKGVALALCLAAGAAWWADPAYHTQTLATALGERSAWTLADGSRVHLNTGSRVDVALHLRSRRLSLASGEASFEVAHAPWHTLLPALERGFTVQVGATRIEDIGTVFNVRRLQDGAVEVSVQQGRVRIDNGHAQSIELGQGQVLRATPRALSQPEPAEVENLTAWHHGRIVFDDTPLADAIAELRRYGPLPVTLRDDAAQLRISGQFELGNREQLIALLPHFAPVRLGRAADGTSIIERLPGSTHAR